MEAQLVGQLAELVGPWGAVILAALWIARAVVLRLERRMVEAIEAYKARTTALEPLATAAPAAVSVLSELLTMERGRVAELSRLVAELEELEELVERQRRDLARSSSGRGAPGERPEVVEVPT